MERTVKGVDTCVRALRIKDETSVCKVTLWRDFVKEHVDSDNFETYNIHAKHQFDHVLGWLSEWGASRTFGLGTKVPFDEQYVIESLSDSTIYMAFYTISHFLQGGVVDGSQPGSLEITPDQLSDAVFDYIFLGKAYPDGCAIPEDKLKQCR